MRYVYCIRDDEISDEFDTIESTLHSAVDNIEEDGTYVYNDKYILVEVMESEDYDDSFKLRLIKLLEDIEEDASYCDNIEDYLDCVNKYDFANKITKIWNNYKKDKGVRGYYKAKNGTQTIYKVYVKKDRYGDYAFVGYDTYRCV